MSGIEEFCLVLALTATGFLVSGRRYIATEKRIALACALLICLFAAGQTFYKSGDLYPFLFWGMYSSPTPPDAFYEFVIVEGDKEIPLDFGRTAFASPGPLTGFSSLSPTMMRLIDLKDECACDRNSDILDRTIGALLRLQGHSSGSDVTEVDFFRTLIDLRNPIGNAREIVYQWKPATQHPGQ